MNWENVDLNDNYERHQNILDSYSFDTLLLEVSCNVKDITKEEIKKQFEIELRNKINSAREVFNNNLDNIYKKALEERRD